MHRIRLFRTYVLCPYNWTVRQQRAAPALKGASKVDGSYGIDGCQVHDSVRRGSPLRFFPSPVWAGSSIYTTSAIVIGPNGSKRKVRVII